MRTGDVLSCASAAPQGCDPVERHTTLAPSSLRSEISSAELYSSLFIGFCRQLFETAVRHSLSKVSPSYECLAEAARGSWSAAGRCGGDRNVARVGLLSFVVADVSEGDGCGPAMIGR